MIGHNSEEGGRLQSFIERLERIQLEIDEKKEDFKDVMTELKSSGFNPSTVREVLKIRRMDEDKRKAKEAELDLYLHALGMIADLPLGAAALHRNFG